MFLVLTSMNDLQCEKLTELSETTVIPSQKEEEERLLIVPFDNSCNIVLNIPYNRYGMSAKTFPLTVTSTPGRTFKNYYVAYDTIPTMGAILIS
jgi:hypothetical protein